MLYNPIYFMLTKFLGYINPFLLRTEYSRRTMSVNADALAPCVTRQSAVIILTMQNKQVLDLHKNKPKLQFCMIFLNLSSSSTAYMHQWIRSVLVQAMACHIFSTKTLFELVLGYCQLSIGPLETNFSEISSKIQNVSLSKMLLKISFVKWRPFCPVEVS